MDEASTDATSRPDGHREFIRLFLGAERELLRYVMVLVPNSTDARDVVQETATALWEKFDQYDREKPFVPWACRFALNEARMYLRKQARQYRLAEDVGKELMAQRIEMAEELDARRVHLRDCLDKLPERQAEIVRAHYFDDLTTPELSERFERSVEAIYKTLQRTRRTLQECIERKLSMETGK